MQNRKVNEETLNNLYKNAHIALQSISNVLPATKDDELIKELKEEYDGYEKIIGKLSSYMVEHGIERKDINPFKKAMLWSSIKMKTLM